MLNVKITILKDTTYVCQNITTSDIREKRVDNNIDFILL